MGVLILWSILTGAASFVVDEWVIPGLENVKTRNANYLFQIKYALLFSLNAICFIGCATGVVFYVLAVVVQLLITYHKFIIESYTEAKDNRDRWRCRYKKIMKSRKERLQ
ncbi:MAG: hypothetical protein EBX40_00620 [Gammaproteobacteria bacterium]|nr:hypothetical protein [Gammaproteobacteria bacterium]